MDEISVVVVSWNARDYLRNCLTSIRETGGSAVRQVIVVDNNSSDGSPDMVAEHFPEFMLIRSNDNLGFARANNAGIARASGSYLAFVNSDVIVHPGCFQRLASFLDTHPRVGLAGPKVHGRDGRVQFTCARFPTVWNTICEFLLLYKAFPRSPTFSGFQERQWDGEEPSEAEVLSGCFWLARRTAVDQVGGLDEQFFFYAEDVDWCKRFTNAGWEIFFVPEAGAIHFGGGSSSNAPLRYSIEMLRANLLYWKKHHGRLGRFTFYLLALIQHCIRFLARSILGAIGAASNEGNRQKIREHLACVRWLITGRGV